MGLVGKRISLIIALTILLIFFNYVKVPCLFHELTGLMCPGCGMTRSIFCYLRLDIIGALKYNLLSIILIYFIVKFFIYGKINLDNKFSIFLLIFVFAYTIIRNL